MEQTPSPSDPLPLEPGDPSTRAARVERPVVPPPAPRPGAAPPRCHRCGYELTGSRGDRCPECGAPRDDLRAARRREDRRERLRMARTAGLALAGGLLAVLALGLLTAPPLEALAMVGGALAAGLVTFIAYVLVGMVLIGLDEPWLSATLKCFAATAWTSVFMFVLLWMGFPSFYAFLLSTPVLALVLTPAFDLEFIEALWIAVASLVLQLAAGMAVAIATGG